MMSRCRSFPWLVAALLASVPSLSRGQDTPLYRDPSPSEGPRIEGPLLPTMPPRTAPVPPPPSGLGPFQTSNLDPSVAPPGEPLLGIPPISPPLPALPMPPFMAEGDVQVRRKTTIRPMNGPFSRCHDWFRELIFGPPKPPTVVTGPKRGLFGVGDWHSVSPDGDALSRLLNWPSWPIWPLEEGH